MNPANASAGAGDGGGGGGDFALIHGWGIGSACWGDAFAELGGALGRKWRLQRISLPGYDGLADLEQSFADCAESLLARLPDGVVVCAWSLGALLALQAATQRRKIRALILVGATPCFAQRDDWHSAQATSVLAAFNSALAADPGATRRRFAALLNQGDTQARALTRTLAAALDNNATDAPSAAALARGLDWLLEIDLRGQLAQLAASALPTLIIHGDRDALTPPAAARALAAAIPDAHSEGFADAAHAPFLADPQRFAHSVADFLARLPPRGDTEDDGAADERTPAPPAKQRIRAAFDRAAASYDGAALVQRRVAELLCAGLPELPAAPAHLPTSLPAHLPTHLPTHLPKSLRVIDAGCGTGYGGALLRQRWPALDLIAVDFAEAMLAHQSHRDSPRVAADIEALPFASRSFDLYWSSLAVQWCDIDRVVGEAARCLRERGRIALSTLGPGTFAELRQAFAGVDRYRHTLAFAAPEAIAAALARAGFADIRSERQTLSFHYAELRQLLAAVRDIGANGVGSGARRGLMSRSVWQAFAAAYERQRDEHGLPASYDVILIQATRDTTLDARPYRQ
jgi:malonyl-CoA O-methyltransferase